MPNTNNNNNNINTNNNSINTTNNNNMNRNVEQSLTSRVASKNKIINVDDKSITNTTIMLLLL